MSKHLKGRIYKRFLRAVCRYPELVKRCYEAYRFVVVRIPFVRSSYKWKLIRTHQLHFEMQRSLRRRGKPCESNILFELSFRQGEAIDSTLGSREGSGSFSLEIGATGLIVKGSTGSGGARQAELLVGDDVLRRTMVSREGEILIKIMSSVLKLFPRRSELRMRLDDGSFLAYRDSDRAILDAPFGSGALPSLLRDGNLLTKKGGIARPAEAARCKQDAYLELYSRVRRVFEAEIGTPLFLMYGTLLGYVRGGDFIPNDDDFDAGFVSKGKSTREVKRETLEVMLKILRAGFDVTVNAVGRLFRVGGGAGAMLDIMPAWFDGPWLIAYGGACVRATEGDFIPASSGSMRGVSVAAPKNAEKILEGYYGKGWRTPDPGYVTDYRQTGVNRRAEFMRFRLSPYEYFKFLSRVERERRLCPGMGRITALGLTMEL